jgi:hypothetical protein
MDEQDQPIRNAAHAFHEASEALEAATDALKPYAEQQATITKNVLTEYNLRDDFKYRAFFRYDYIEFSYGPYYNGTHDVPAVECELWERGCRGETDSRVGSFTLNRHIINGEPEKFEAELRAELQPEAQKKAQREREQKERQIAELQAELKNMEDSLK